VHQHKGCIITQRDIGTDTFSFGMALKNVLRQRPDVVLIGEMRDRETVEHALHFAETGHLCVGTLHAGNSYQAMEHILNFFPEEKHYQIRHNLAQNLRGILSQRLVLTRENTRCVAVEIMLNRGHIRNLIQENKMKEIMDIMAKNRNEGMQTFDQSLYDLYNGGIIDEDVAIAESENPANLRLQIRAQQNSKRGAVFSSSPVLPGLKPSSSSVF
jgi:twitching motility protein PilU